MKYPIVLWYEAHQEMIDLERRLTEISKEMNFPPMFSWCEECNTRGNCFPYDRRCGNCNSLKVTRYYNEGAILELLRSSRRSGSESIRSTPINPGGATEEDNAGAMAETINPSSCRRGSSDPSIQNIQRNSDLHGITNVRIRDFKGKIV